MDPGTPERTPGFVSPIDREKLCASLRRLSRREVFEVLDRAIEAVPKRRLLAVIARSVDPSTVVPSSDLIAEVTHFCEASRRGEYYESFDVNWKNCTQTSRGTEAWIADCERLFRKCLKRAKSVGPLATRQALSLLFDLLRAVDSRDGIVFWADEGGSYEVSIDEKKVLGLWLLVLATTAPPEEFAREGWEAIRDFGKQHCDELVSCANSIASDEQRAAFGAFRAASRR